LQPQTPLWFSARRRRRSRIDAAQLKAPLQFFGLLLAACGSSLLLLILIWMSRAELPTNARTTAEWTALLRAPDLSMRTDAVQDLSRVAVMPVLPCDIMVERLTDAAAVRIQSVALLTKVLSLGRCIPEVLDVLAGSAPSRSRVAAAQIVGAALDDAEPSAASTSDRSLAHMAGARMLLDPDQQIREAATEMLDRVARHKPF
jgi:hypothetical protein